jgi:DNA-binding NarL/FixJ family response regulator
VSESTGFRRALIIEDIPEVNGWMAQMILQVFPDMEIEQAYTLKQGNHLLKRGNHYDIALIDLGLPDGNGLDIIEYCTTHCPQVLTIVVTIFEDDQHLFKALQQGAQGYLLKDMEAKIFQHHLVQIAHGEAVLSPVFVKKMMQYMRQIGLNTATKSLPIVLPLTRREKEVLTYIGRGLSVNETAEKLGISSNTVASYIKDIYRKLNISSRAEAVLIALQYGLI